MTCFSMPRLTIASSPAAGFRSLTELNAKCLKNDANLKKRLDQAALVLD